MTLTDEDKNMNNAYPHQLLAGHAARVLQKTASVVSIKIIFLAAAFALLIISSGVTTFLFLLLPDYPEVFTYIIVGIGLTCLIACAITIALES